jgi:hypothetical protein
LLYFEKADNSDGLYSTLGQLLNAANDLNASGDVADDSHSHVYSDTDATTSANWAGRFTDEEGTGKFVLNDSPTFVDDITVTKIIGTAGNTIVIKIPSGYTFAVTDSSDVTKFEVNEDGLINPGASLPSALFADDDAVGSAAIDEYAAKLEGNLEDTGDGTEDGSLKVKIRVGGSDTLVDYAVFNGNTAEIDIGTTATQTQLLLKTAGANDGNYDGFVRTYTVDSGATSVFGQALHVDTDGELIVADGDVASAGAMPAIGLAVEAGTGSKKVLLQGTICETDWTWTVGGIVYVSDDPTTTEGLTQTAISTTGDTVQVVGIATTADCIEVNMGGYVLVEVP